MAGQNQMELFDISAMTPDQILGNMESGIREDPRSWPALLAELVDVIADHLEVREGLGQTSAMEKAQDLVAVIAHHLGGRPVYLPKDEKLRLAIRDRAIFRAFDGSNHVVLAKQTGLTTSQIYNIIAQQRRLRESKQYMKLPFPKSSEWGEDDVG